MNFKILMTAGVFAIFTVSCAETAHDQKSGTEAVPEVKAPDLSSNPDYKKGLALVAQSDCLTCHAVNDKTTGPAYSEVAAKYAGANDSTITMLAQTIIKGGSGNWGQIPMTPHPTVSEEDAKQMVKYILLLKK
jgi:cytochrome c